jgi:hypothetical protein
VGGAVPREQQGRPARFGSHPTSSNRATPAANKRSRKAQLLARRHVAANALSARVMACPCQSALAVGAPPEACLSHPPALQLGSAFQGRVGGNTSLSCHIGGRCALAATQPPAIGQRLRPTSAFEKRSSLHGGTWRPMPSVQELWLALAKAPWPSVRRPRLVSPTHPPCSLAPLFRGGWVGIPP